MFLHLNLIKLREITNPRIDMYQISETVAEIWKTAVDGPDCQIIALTGAGISSRKWDPHFSRRRWLLENWIYKLHANGNGNS